MNIEAASPHDHRARQLLALHYKAGSPKAVAAVSVATVRGQVAGAMWVTFPTLNGRWREQAWGQLPLGKRERAAWLNTNVRTIARVIVEPRFRACGVATQLVRQYLVTPLTQYTEALAAMGRVSPFFARAGMREVCVAATPRDERMRRRLHELGIEPWRLMEAGAASELLRGSSSLRSSVLAWARKGKATLRHARLAEHDDEVLMQLAMLCASAVQSPPVVYVAEREEGKEQQDAGEH